jgi:hypothetical protein
MIHSDCRGTTPGGLHCQSPYDMVMGVMEIDDVKSLLINIARDTLNVAEQCFEEIYLVRLGDRRKTKDTNAVNAFFFRPYLHALRNLKRGAPIGQGHLMPSLLEGQAEVYQRLGRSRPLPIGEEVEDLQPFFNPLWSSHNLAYFIKT